MSDRPLMGFADVVRLGGRCLGPYNEDEYIHHRLGWALRWRIQSGYFGEVPLAALAQQDATVEALVFCDAHGIAPTMAELVGYLAIPLAGVT